MMRVIWTCDGCKDTVEFSQRHVRDPAIMPRAWREVRSAEGQTEAVYCENCMPYGGLPRED